MLLKPLNDRVLVRRVESETKTAGGIIIPESAKEKPAEAEVIAVGPGRLLENGERSVMQVKAGDKILFGKYSGTDVQIDRETLLILKEDDILGVIE